MDREVERRQDAALDTLADQINAEHRAFAASLRKTVEHGIRAGELLVEAKAQCPHGTWLTWLTKNFEGAPRTAQEYMRLYNHRDELRAKYAESAYLSISRALKELAASPSAEAFIEVVEFIEREGHRLASIEPPNRVGDSPEQQKFYNLELGLTVSLRSIGEDYLRMLEQVRKIREKDGEGRGAGWLRETLISMCQGPYGHRYRMALREARERLLEVVEDEGLRRRIAGPLDEGTVSIDLTEQETTLLKAVAPSLPKEVQEAWEEDKEYELALRKMERFTRPIDVPPGRERGGLEDRLTDEQMQTTFAELRHTGKLDAAMRRRPE